MLLVWNNKQTQACFLWAVLVSIDFISISLRWSIEMVESVHALALTSMRTYCAKYKFVDIWMIHCSIFTIIISLFQKSFIQAIVYYPWKIDMGIKFVFFLYSNSPHTQIIIQATYICVYAHPFDIVSLFKLYRSSLYIAFGRDFPSNYKFPIMYSKGAHFNFNSICVDVSITTTRILAWYPEASVSKK